ncbi:MoaD/ThiS family protein [Candidatus Pyrohabitans sp.]
MKVTVIIGKEAREVEVSPNATAGGVLKALGINREEVIIKLGDEIITEEERLSEGSVIEVIRVISGG